MGRLRNTLAVAAVGAALSATQASAAEPAPASTIAPALEENETLAAPAAPAPSGGTAVEAPVAGGGEVVGAVVLVELLQAAASTARVAPRIIKRLAVIMAG